MERILGMNSPAEPIWGFKGDLYCCWPSDSILGYSILTPHYHAGFTS